MRMYYSVHKLNIFDQIKSSIESNYFQFSPLKRKCELSATVIDTIIIGGEEREVLVTVYFKISTPLSPPTSVLTFRPYISIIHCCQGRPYVGHKCVLMSYICHPDIILNQG